MLNILLLVIVGLLWGATNPFIRLGSQGIEQINTGSKWKNLLLELRMISMRLKYWVPFLLNQAGSVLYVYTLQDTSITAAVPVANSLSFVFTAITGYLLGEKIPGRKVVIGTVLVCLGSSIVLYDKLRNEQQLIQ
ncbi:transmembrane protein 234 homolog [Teleopsis dalmanni]|uniref:transmembrane protein 234 homolog n=1 Tax=Teleopsis dalmanni TaxID=139649 RepID=UPI0018CDAC99|nr:transmembrane protein 234 homolog [Teleopsis dalmanni]